MKGLVIFGFGAVFGSLGTLFWLQKDYKKRLEKMETELYSSKNGAENEEKEGSEDPKSNKNSTDSDEQDGSELRRVEENQKVLDGISGGLGYSSRQKERPGNDILGREETAQKVNYSSFSRSENDEKSVSIRKMKSDTVSLSYAIYEISFEDFEFSRPEYPKKCVKFFAENDVFVDYDGTVIDTLISGTGEWSENLKRYMPEKMWVRDDKFGCDYEISVVDDAYISDDFDDEKGE